MDIFCNKVERPSTTFTHLHHNFLRFFLENYDRQTNRTDSRQTDRTGYREVTLPIMNADQTQNDLIKFYNQSQLSTKLLLNKKNDRYIIHRYIDR